MPGAVTYAASAVPDRIVLSWSEDPATTQSVTWRTDRSVAKAVAEFVLASSDPAFHKGAKRIAASSTDLSTNLGEARFHTAVFRGLQPKTMYAYRVGDGVNWSEWSQFTTASTEAEPFSFIYFGDAQNNLKSHWARVVREAFKDAPRAAFLLHAGDLINHADNDEEWGEWFYSAGWILRTMPSIATPGNHEYMGAGTIRRLSLHWRPTFDFPVHGPKGCEETVYYVDYQGARIVSLNTNRDLKPQAQWFSKVMQGCKARWKIVTMHHPVYSTEPRRDNPAIRDLLQPLFEKYGVDLVLQGHDHAYGRTTRMVHPGGSTKQVKGEVNVPVGLRARPDQHGAVYVVSVSGPKSYNLRKRPFMVSAAQRKQLYQVINVYPGELRYSAYEATGTVYDRFRLIKRNGTPNHLVEGL